jgi:hypothetical protein
MRWRLLHRASSTGPFARFFMSGFALLNILISSVFLPWKKN